MSTSTMSALYPFGLMIVTVIAGLSLFVNTLYEYRLGKVLRKDLIANGLLIFLVMLFYACWIFSVSIGGIGFPLLVVCAGFLMVVLGLGKVEDVTMFWGFGAQRVFKCMLYLGCTICTVGYFGLIFLFF